MKFAVFTTTTPEWTQLEAAQKLRAQGWDGIEWGINDFPPADTPSFRAGNRAVWPFTGLEETLPQIERVRDETGLAVSALAPYALAHQKEDVERLLAATAALGAERVRVVAPHVRSADYRTLLRDVRDDYQWVAERAAHHGVKALVEIHFRLMSSSAAMTMDIVDGLDPQYIGIIHDLGNLMVEGREDYLTSFQMMGDYLAHVHLKNVVWVAEEPDQRGVIHHHWEWAPLRKGIADVKEYFEALRKVDYQGWVTVEDFSTELAVEQRTADNLAYLREVWAEVESMSIDDLCIDESDVMWPAHLRR
jgi:sugar phosphate isomerase/epimerase